MNGDLPVLLRELTTRRDRAQSEARGILNAAQARGEKTLTDIESRQFKEHVRDRDTLDARIKSVEEDLRRTGADSPLLTRLLGAASSGMENAADRQSADWAREIATRIAGNGPGQERREISTGALDVPSLVLPYVVPIPWPVRLIDLFTNRVAAQSNSIEYFQESARTNNATVVADAALKPTSAFTVKRGCPGSRRT